MLYRFYPPIQHDKRPKIKTIIWALEINKEAYKHRRSEIFCTIYEGSASILCHILTILKKRGN